MAKQSLNTIRTWFKSTLMPTQAQFWDTWDSFWHKDELIPTARIEGLNDRFQEKADEEAFAGHLTDADAHKALFDAKAPLNHGHAIAQVVGLTEALAEKQATLTPGVGIQIDHNVISVIGGLNTVAFGKFQIFKAYDNELPEVQTGDIVRGFIDNFTFIHGQYTSGATTDINSYTIFEQIDLTQPGG